MCIYIVYYMKVEDPTRMSHRILRTWFSACACQILYGIYWIFLAKLTRESGKWLFYDIFDIHICLCIDIYIYVSKSLALPERINGGVHLSTTLGSLSCKYLLVYIGYTRMPISEIYDTLKYCYVFTTWGVYVFFLKNWHSNQGLQTPKCQNPGGFGAQRSTGAGRGHLWYFGWWMKWHGCSRFFKIATSHPQSLNFWGSKSFEVVVVEIEKIGTRVGWWCDTK